MTSYGLIEFHSVAETMFAKTMSEGQADIQLARLCPSEHLSFYGLYKIQENPG